MKKAWLYITTNTINGKKYIGQTTSKRKNYLGSGRLISAAIKKYGRENFIRENVFEGSWEEVDLLEALYIEKFDAINSDEFYNLKEGGHHGKHNNPETIKRMSKKATGRKASLETKQKMSSKSAGINNAFFGKSHSASSIAKIKEARSKQIISAESNRKRSASMIGHKKETATCPHCGLTGGKGNMIRYHFDNCKKKI
jgi:group I intron endonuclease